jgi:hypothetical protein
MKDEEEAEKEWNRVYSDLVARIMMMKETVGQARSGTKCDQSAVITLLQKQLEPETETVKAPEKKLKDAKARQAVVKLRFESTTAQPLSGAESNTTAVAPLNLSAAANVVDLQKQQNDQVNVQYQELWLFVYGDGTALNRGTCGEDGKNKMKIAQLIMDLDEKDAEIAELRMDAELTNIGDQDDGSTPVDFQAPTISVQKPNEGPNMPQVTIAKAATNESIVGHVPAEALPAIPRKSLEVVSTPPQGREFLPRSPGMHGSTQASMTRCVQITLSLGGKRRSRRRTPRSRHHLPRATRHPQVPPLGQASSAATVAGT